MEQVKQFCKHSFGVSNGMADLFGSQKGFNVRISFSVFRHKKKYKENDLLQNRLGSTIDNRDELYTSTQNLNNIQSQVLIGLALFQGKNLYPTKIVFLILGQILGLRILKKYYRERRLKRSKLDLLRKNFDVDFNSQDIAQLIYSCYWASFSQYEKAQWFNKFIEKLWPCYEVAVCQQLGAYLEQQLRIKKPSYISNLQVNYFTFGDVPIYIDAIEVIKEDVLQNGKDHFSVDFDFSWRCKGRVSVSLQLSGGVVINLKLQKLFMGGKMRLTFCEFYPKMPCFGCILLSFQQKPVVKFSIDPGVGDDMGSVLKQWLYPLLYNDVLTRGLIAPNKLVIRLLPEELIGSLDEYRPKVKGILFVKVLACKQLHRRSLTKTYNPLVQLSVNSLQYIYTKTLQNTNNPQWDNESHYLLVNDPQVPLYVEIQDEQAQGVQLLQNLCHNERKVIGTCEVDYNYEQLHQAQGMVDKYYDIQVPIKRDSKGEGHTRGQIRLVTFYQPLSKLYETIEQNQNLQKGILFVLLKQVFNLPRAGYQTFPSVKLQVEANKVMSRVIHNTTDPVFDQSFEFFNVFADSTFKIKVYHNYGINMTKKLGQAVLCIGDYLQQYQAEEQMGQFIREVVVNLYDSKRKVVGTASLDIDWFPLTKGSLTTDSSKKDRIILDYLSEQVLGSLFIRIVQSKNIPRQMSFGILGLEPHIYLKVNEAQKWAHLAENRNHPNFIKDLEWHYVMLKSKLEIEVVNSGAYGNKIVGKKEIELEQLQTYARRVKKLHISFQKIQDTEEDQVHVHDQMGTSLQEEKTTAPQVEILFYWVPYDNNIDQGQIDTPDLMDDQQIFKHQKQENESRKDVDVHHPIWPL